MASYFFMSDAADAHVAYGKTREQIFIYRWRHRRMRKFRQKIEKNSLKGSEIRRALSCAGGPSNGMAGR